MVSKTCRILGFVFITWFTLPEKSHERYLLVELDGESEREYGETTEQVPEEAPIEEYPADPGYLDEEPPTPLTRRPRNQPSPKHKLKAFRAGNSNFDS